MLDSIIYCQVPAVLPRSRRPALNQPGRGSPGGEARLRPQGGGGAGPGRQQEQPAVPRAVCGPLQQGVKRRMCEYLFYIYCVILFTLYQFPSLLIVM